MNKDSGLTWGLSIVFLVITIRLLLFRFFIKQVHSQRKMQEVQPKIAALREKYKNDRQTLSQEMMKLQKEEGFNPIGGCLPILMQAPVFIALFHVLRLIGTPQASALYNEYHWTQAQAASAGNATVFGAPIASAFTDPRNLVGQIPGASATATHVVALVLIVLMVAATYTTQRQVMLRSTTTLDSQQAMIQKLMLYGVPASLTVSGFFFPIGVLFYWFTNNLWSMGQQFYILKRMPHPDAKKDTVDPEVARALAPKPAAEAGPADQAHRGDRGVRTARRTVRTARLPPARPPPARRRRARRPTAPPRTARRPVPKPAPGREASGRGQARGRSRAAGAPSRCGRRDRRSRGPQWRPRRRRGRRGPTRRRNCTARPRAKPGPGARPGGAGGRRPQGQRSPTQTQQKKKRR